jgi:para-aminobenzoate synthetase component I
MDGHQHAEDEPDQLIRLGGSSPPQLCYTGATCSDGPLMTSLPPVQAVWRDSGRFHVARSAVHTIRIDEQGELATLSARVAEILGAGQLAVGVIGYAGTTAEVVIVDQHSIAALPDADPCTPFHLLSEFSSNLPHSDYLHAIARIHHYLRAGDCYQVNFARRFSARF